VIFVSALSRLGTCGVWSTCRVADMRKVLYLAIASRLRPTGVPAWNRIVIRVRIRNRYNNTDVEN